MKSTDKIKSSADTYYFCVSKIALFFTALFAVSVMYLVYSMTSSPALAVKYFYAIPGLLKNVLLVCTVSLIVGTVMEIGTN